MRVVDLGTLHVKRVCPAKGQLCAKCGKRGHWAACYRNEADGNRKLCKSDGRGSESNNWRSCGATSERNLKPRGQQVNQVDYNSKKEQFSFPINYIGERAYEYKVISERINGTVTRMLVDSGAPSTLLGKQQFHNLVRSGLRVNLMPEERNLGVYGNGCLA